MSEDPRDQVLGVDLPIAINRLYDEIDRLRASHARLLEALREIVNPVGYMRQRAEAEGEILNEHMATAVAENVSHPRSIARAAIAAAEGGGDE